MSLIAALKSPGVTILYFEATVYALKAEPMVVCSQNRITNPVQRYITGCAADDGSLRAGVEC
jgi:hypothetical protein